VADSDPANWAETIHINLIGAYHTAHAAIPHLRARGVNGYQKARKSGGKGYWVQS